METRQILTEDDLYRASTQYRLWSFSSPNLQTLRQTTHTSALARAHFHLSTSQHALLPSALDEQRLVQRYGDQVRSTSDFFKWPVNVKATAVQYLKRFYLTNSVLTYPPKEIYKTVLFLASKTEGTHMSLSEYARRISTDPQAILAPEYKIVQALRFTLDVRQPFRGLKGALMELLNLAAGQCSPLPWLDATAKQLQEQMAALPPPGPAAKSPWQSPQASDPRALADRAHCAYATARHLLDAPALLTDVYFLYTPPQIYMAALQIADAPLTRFYLATKIPSDSPAHDTVIATINACADMLAAFDQTQVMSKEERAELEKRLEEVRDPSTRDLVRRHEDMKRGGAEEGKLGDEVVEKRKLAREASMKEGEDLFGPAL